MASSLVRLIFPCCLQERGRREPKKISLIKRDGIGFACGVSSNKKFWNQKLLTSMFDK